MIHIYGIPNCDSVKKALDYCKQNKAGFTFHDFKSEGVTKEKLKGWLKQVPLENLLNKKSTTWRDLTPDEQQKASVRAGAIQLMQQKTSVIKRPVVEWPDGSITTGFKADVFDAHL